MKSIKQLGKDMPGFIRPPFLPIAGEQADSALELLGIVRWRDGGGAGMHLGLSQQRGGRALAEGRLASAGTEVT